VALEPGRQLAQYKLVDRLGEGGMGEVWRATDTTLGRDVAIKVLPAAFSADAERLARFEREARVLASLNHASIAGIYGLHEQGGVRFLAMELVPGEDLAHRLSQGALPFSEAAEIARQIAEALETAHEQGIVHRDLKPANVRITPDGKVKVLDFGLAKAIEGAMSDGSGRDAALSPTITSLGTMAGVVLGTAAYMSPEQARGKPVDKRADIWAFGGVLFEMLAGRRPFEGETISDTLAAVLAKDVDWQALPPAVPPRVRDLLARCLDKDPKHRLRDVGDARIELESALAERTASGRVRVAETPVAAAPAAASRAVAWVALAAGLVVGASIMWAVAGRASSDGGSGILRLDIAFPTDVRVGQYLLAPDGSAVFGFGSPRVPAGTPEPPTRIYVRRLDAGSFHVLRGSEGCLGFGLSADGRDVFMSIPTTAGSSQSQLVRVPADESAPPLTLAPFDPHWIGFTSLNNGDILTLRNDWGLVRIPADGSGPKPLGKADFGSTQGQIIFSPVALPGDKAALFHSVAYGAKGWYYRIGVLDLATAKVTYLFDDGGYPTFVAAGEIVFTRGDALFAIRFDPEARKVSGAPVPIVNGLSTPYSFQPAFYGLARNGTLLFQPGGRTAEGRRLALVGPGDTVTPVIEEGHPYQTVGGGTADGRAFVATITNGQGIDEVFIGEIDRPGLRRLFAVPDADLITPVLSRDGRRVAFSRRGRNADDGFYVEDVDGGAQPRKIARLLDPDNGVSVWGFTPDGAGLIVSGVDAGAKGDLDYIAIPAPGAPIAEPTPLVAGPADQASASLSPDGRWLAFASDDSGRPEIYVTGFDRGGTTGETVRVTRNGGVVPQWSQDGRQLRYRELNGRQMGVAVTAQSGLVLGAPTFLYDGIALNVRPFAMAADGRQLAVLRGQDESDEIRRCSIVLNFTRELEEKLKAAR
jgi:serine/threonine-protein kinase